MKKRFNITLKNGKEMVVFASPTNDIKKTIRSNKGYFNEMDCDYFITKRDVRCEKIEKHVPENYNLYRVLITDSYEKDYDKREFSTGEVTECKYFYEENF